MNILYITHERNLGGASKSLIELSCGMKARGHKVFVIVPVKNCNVQKELEKRGILVFPVFFLWWQYPSYWNHILKKAFQLGYLIEYLTLWKAKKYVEKYKIDVIHSNSSVIDFGMKLAQMCGIRHIWHFREFGALDYQLEYFKGKRKSLQQLNESRSDVIFISKRLWEYYSKYIDTEKSTVVYNGINVNKPGKRENLEINKIIFLTSGNFHRNKCQDVVIKAVKHLLKEGYTEFEVWFAGQASSMSDSKKYERELKKEAAPLGDYIKFLGFISDMKQLRQKANVEIVPSAEEAFGRVVVEAMLAAMPVIGSDSGAIPEIIKDKENGLLFPNGDAEELKKRMEYFIKDKKLVNKMGMSARDYVIKNFSLEKNLDEIESIYQS